MANREAATKEKELGNAAYKKKDFNSAISHYTKVSPRVFFISAVLAKFQSTFTSAVLRSLSIFDRLRLEVFFLPAPAPATKKKEGFQPLKLFLNNIPSS